MKSLFHERIMPERPLGKILSEKLGVKANTKVSVLGVKDKNFLAELERFIPVSDSADLKV